MTITIKFKFINDTEAIADCGCIMEYKKITRQDSRSTTGYDGLTLIPKFYCEQHKFLKKKE